MADELPPDQDRVGQVIPGAKGRLAQQRLEDPLTAREILPDRPGDHEPGVAAEHVHDVRDDLADQRQVIDGLIVAAPQPEQAAHVGRPDANREHGVGVPGEQVPHGEQLADAGLGVNGLRRLENRHAVERQPGFCSYFCQNFEKPRAACGGEFRENKSGQNSGRRANFLDQRADLVGMPDPDEQQRKRDADLGCRGPAQLGQLRGDVALGRGHVRVPDRVLQAENR